MHCFEKQFGNHALRWVWKNAPQISGLAEKSTAPESKKLSDRVKGWYEEIDAWAKTFMEEVDQAIEGPDGLFQSSYRIGESEEFRKLMLLRLNSTVRVLKERVRLLDEHHRDEDADHFDSRVKPILEESQQNLFKLKDEVVNAGRGIAALGGEDAERIDTKKEAWLYEQNLAAFYQEIDTPQGRKALKADAESYLPAVEFHIGPQEGLITKIMEGGRLTAGEYETIVIGLEKIWDRGIDMKNEATQRQSYKLLERTAAFLPLHVMNAEQRFKVAEHWVNRHQRNPAAARKAVELLCGVNMLDLQQAESLMEKVGVSFTEEEKTKLQQTRKAVSDAQKFFEKIYGEEGGKNLFLEHGTAANFLIYEVAGRVAIAGALLPLILNIGSPKKFPDIMTDPAWLSCVGIGAASFEHISGGLGKGMVTEAVLSLGDGPDEQTVAEQQDAAREKSREKLDELCGSYPETVAFLTRNEGRRLEEIDRIAIREEKSMKDGYYLFQFKDWVDYKVKQAEEKAKKPWTPEQARAEHTRWNGEAETPRDGLEPIQVQKAIQDLYHVLAHELKATTVEAMLNEVRLSRGRRSLA